MVDTLFFDSAGRSLMQHYRLITGVVLTERGSGISNATFFLTPTGQNTSRFNNSLGTFQGPYTGINLSGIDTNSPYLSNVINTNNYPTSPYYNWLWNSNQQTTNNTVSGVLFDGVLHTGSFGNSQDSINGGYGWGSVYGLVGNLNYFSQFYDCGLTDHNITGGTGALSITPPPNNTGLIYWPSVVNGTPVTLNITGVTFFSHEFGTILDTGWFNFNRQIIEKVTFFDNNSSCVPAGLLNNGNSQQMIYNPTGFTNQNVPIQNPSSPVYASEYGYYLTTVRYNYANLSSSDQINFVCSVNNVAFTGFIDTGTSASCSTNNVINTNTITGKFLTGIVPVISAPNFSLVNAITITGLFTGLSQRGYTNGINGTPISAGQPLEFFLSGFSGSKPLYLTYLQVSGEGTNTIAHSYLNPSVHVTSFMRPTGYLIHEEKIINPNQLFQTSTAAILTTGYRLLPNYGLPNNIGVNTYSPQTGGYYPGLSFNNTLEAYMDISYSSPCSAGDNTCVNAY
jgi:hypothetical protein